MIRRLLKPGGRLILGDILRPEVGMIRDVIALLRFAASQGFLKDALIGLLSTALSDYRQLRFARRATALQRERDDRKAQVGGGFAPPHAHMSISDTIPGG